MLYCIWLVFCCFFFFFNVTATPEIYTLSLHDALPISRRFAPEFSRFLQEEQLDGAIKLAEKQKKSHVARVVGERSEEHTSELQSLTNLVCRLLLEKKKKKYT